MARPRKIEIYDTTLRDGNQGEGVNLSLADKLEITLVLDAMGIDYIEGGWPGSNPKDEAYFTEVKKLSLAHAGIVAFGSTRRADAAPEDDIFLQKLVQSKADVTCIFGKTWDLHVQQALRVSGRENLNMIEESVRFLSRETARPVFYDAEHFFDGFKSDEEYALETIRAALAGGAERIILCDTNGGILPAQVAEAVQKLRAELPEARLGIHVHNDGGLAVANTLSAVEAGAIQVQGTINGVGERCGNVDLTSVIGNLELKMGFSCLPEGSVGQLTRLSRKVWERLGRDGPGGQPFVGSSAFAHKGGVHVSAVLRNPVTYEHIRPEQVGNARKVLVSELSGGSNIRAKLGNRYQEVQESGKLKAILQEIQDKEHTGYSFEGADGSFDLLVRRHLGTGQPLFEPINYRIYSPAYEMESGDVHDHEHLIEASVKVRVQGSETLCAAEGRGPVDALNQALRKALLPSFPVLNDLHLSDYSVRVINSTEETAAKVRVMFEHHFQGAGFATQGVNVDVIKASWLGLLEACEYALLQHADFAGETAGNR